MSTNSELSARLLGDQAWEARIASCVESALMCIGLEANRREVACVMAAVVPEIAELIKNADKGEA